MIDKANLTPGTKLKHVMLGDVLYTENCLRMEHITGNITRESMCPSIHVEHDGDIKEVTLSLVSLKE